jgi:hypothetical protein
MFRTKIIGVLSAAALLTVLAGAPAFAANTNTDTQLGGGSPGNGDTSLTINDGGLRFDPVDQAGNQTEGGSYAGWTMPTFTGVTLGGTPILTGVELPPFSVIDATGSEAGWHVDLAVTDLTLTGANPIPAANMSMTRPWVADQASTTAPDVSTRTNNADVTPSNTADYSTPQTFVSAALGHQDTSGTFLISPMPLRVLVPADANAGTYDGTVTVTLTTGP